MRSSSDIFQQIGDTRLVRLRGERTSVHINPVPCILFGWERPVTVETAKGTITADAVLADSRTPHLVDFGGGATDVLYLEAAEAHGMGTQSITGNVYHLLAETLDRWSTESAAELATMLGFTPRRAEQPILDLIDLIDRDSMDRLSERDASAITGLERTALHKRFKRQTGMTFRAYKNWAALKNAAPLLPTEEKIGTLGLDAGYADAAHFSRRFKAAFGLSPSEAQKFVA